MKKRTKFTKDIKTNISLDYKYQDYDESMLKRFRNYLLEKGVLSDTADNYLSAWKNNKKNSHTAKRHFHIFYNIEMHKRQAKREFPMTKSKLFDASKKRTRLESESKPFGTFDTSFLFEKTHPSTSIFNDEEIQTNAHKEAFEDWQNKCKLEIPTTEQILKNRIEQVFMLNMPINYKLDFIQTIVSIELRKLFEEKDVNIK